MMPGVEVRLEQGFEAALERATAALAEQGFGIISRVDLDRAFAEKLGTRFRRYTILGACNPSLAHAALSAAPEVGLLLPCNVTVEEDGSGTLVRLVRPEAMVAMLDGERAATLGPVMADAAERLGRVAEALGGRAMAAP